MRYEGSVSARGQAIHRVRTLKMTYRINFNSSLTLLDAGIALSGINVGGQVLKKLV